MRKIIAGVAMAGVVGGVAVLLATTAASQPSGSAAQKVTTTSVSKTTTAQQTTGHTLSTTPPPSATSCNYPANLPVLSLAPAAQTYRTATTVTFTGSLTKNKCYVKDIIIKLYNTKTNAVVGSDVTNGSGKYTIYVKVSSTTTYVAKSVATNAYPSATSNTSTITISGK